MLIIHAPSTMQYTQTSDRIHVFTYKNAPQAVVDDFAYLLENVIPHAETGEVVAYLIDASKSEDVRSLFTLVQRVREYAEKYPDGPHFCIAAVNNSGFRASVFEHLVNIAVASTAGRVQVRFFKAGRQQNAMRWLSKSCQRMQRKISESSVMHPAAAA